MDIPPVTSAATPPPYQAPTTSKGFLQEEVVKAKQHITQLKGAQEQIASDLHRAEAVVIAFETSIQILEEDSIPKQPELALVEGEQDENPAYTDGEDTADQGDVQ